MMFYQYKYILTSLVEAFMMLHTWIRYKRHVCKSDLKYVYILNILRAYMLDISKIADITSI